jgi:signal transduction histidine kinase/CheY-like chemotaxis protein
MRPFQETTVVHPGARNPFLEDPSSSGDLRLPSGSAGQRSRQSPANEGRKARILIVDDVALDREVLAEHLESQGYELARASNGEEALARVGDARPDIVLLDLAMPGMDGFEVCRRIKAGQTDRFLPVILVSARGDTQSKIKGLGCGADGYITKGIDREELTARVESMLRIKRLEETLAIEKRSLEIEKRKIERVIASMRDGVIIVGKGGDVILNPSVKMILAARLDDPQCDYDTLCRVLSFDPLKSLEKDEEGQPLQRDIVIGEDSYGAITSPLPFPADGTGRSRLAPTLQDNSEVGGAVVVLRNVTREKALDRLRTEFISYVSHELRTPLTSIKSSLSLLQSGRTGELRPEVEKFVGIAHRNVHRLAGLIDDLLDLSRIEAGKLEMSFIQCAVWQPIEASLACLTGQAEAKKIAIHAELEPGLPSIYAEAKKIEQVVTNLVGNALKFTPEGGKITVRAGVVESPPKPAGNLKIKTRQYILVSIEDTGAGIPPYELENIFDKFHQVRRSETKGGSGLGLPIAKSLIEAHGGAIWAESVPRRGSCFSFLLPVLDAESFYYFNVQTTLERCKRSHEVLSVILLRVEAGIEGRTQGADAVLDASFDRIVDTIQKNLYRQTDVISPFKKRREIRVLLQATTKADALNALHRLERKLKEAFESEESMAPSLLFGVASYPEDGTSAPELEFCLSQCTARLRVRGDGDLEEALDPFSEV